MEFAGAQAKKVEGTDGSSRILVIRTGDALAAGMDSKTIERIYDVMAQDRVNRKIEPEDIMERSRRRVDTVLNQSQWVIMLFHS